MAEIFLPRRSARPGGGGRRVARAPTAANVPRIPLVSDPGLKVNKDAFTAVGRAVGAFGKQAGESGPKLVFAADTIIKKEAVRQQRLTDATEGAKARASYAATLNQGFETRSEFGFGDEAVRGEFEGFVHNQGIDTLKNIAGRLSPEALTRLEASVAQIGESFNSRAARAHLSAQEQTGMTQLTQARDAAVARVRQDPDGVLGELDLYGDTAAAFTGAFKGDEEQDHLTLARAGMVGAALSAFAGRGRAEEARGLLDNSEIIDLLDGATRARLRRNTEALITAHDRDRVERDQRRTSEEASARDNALVAFTSDFRSRMATGDATQAEITVAETGGVLTPEQADGLRAEMAAQQARQAAVSVRAGRIAAILQQDGRLDPEDFDDHDDVNHHFNATLKPILATMEPAQRAKTIGGYVAQIGIAPKAAVQSLLALSATGEPQDRIKAAQELVAVLNTDPSARDTVPPALAAHAETMVQLADLEVLPPDEIVRTADTLFKVSTQAGTATDQAGGRNGSSPKGVQVAAAPLLGALPALGISTESLLAFGTAALSALGIAGVLGLSGDTMQAGEGKDGEDDEDADNGNAKDAENPLNLPVQPPAPGRPEDPTPPDFPPTTEQKDDDQRRDAPPIRLIEPDETSGFVKRQARRMSQQAKQDVVRLKTQFSKGNLQPGIGTRDLFEGFLELRGRNGGRVILRKISEGNYDIVGQFQGHSRGDTENSRVIKKFIDDYLATR